jgi:hypothetical protein
MCSFNILYYGSVSARFSEKPRFRFGFSKTEPRFRFGFGFVNCFSALGLPRMHFNDVFVFIPFTSFLSLDLLTLLVYHLKDWKLKRGGYVEVW